MSKDLISISEAADLLGTHADTLRKWEKRLWITPVYTEGGHRRYDRAKLEKMSAVIKNLATYHIQFNTWRMMPMEMYVLADCLHSVPPEECHSSIEMARYKKVVDDIPPITHRWTKKIMLLDYDRMGPLPLLNYEGPFTDYRLSDVYVVDYPPLKNECLTISTYEIWKQEYRDVCMDNTKNMAPEVIWGEEAVKKPDCIEVRYICYKRID